MKNMKKLLALGAVLAMGTTAMGAGNTADFDVKLSVVQPLVITTGGEIDFGTLNLNDLNGGERASQTFSVAGGRDLEVDLAITGDTLTNGDGGTIKFTAFNLDSQNGEDKVSNITLSDDGSYDGHMVVELGEVTELGDYTGTVTLVASYK